MAFLSGPLRHKAPVSLWHSWVPSGGRQRPPQRSSSIVCRGYPTSAAPGCAPTSFDLGRCSQVCMSRLSAARRIGSLVPKRSSWSAVGAPPGPTCASGLPSPDDVPRTCGPPVGSGAALSVPPPSVPPASFLPRLYRAPTGRRALQYRGNCCCLPSTHTPLSHLLHHRVEVSLWPHEIVAQDAENPPRFGLWPAIAPVTIAAAEYAPPCVPQGGLVLPTAEPAGRGAQGVPPLGVSDLFIL